MNEKIQFPDYPHSILGIPNSLLKYYGAAHSYPSLSLLDEFLDRPYHNVVLMIFDGMGSDMLAHNLPANAFLNRHKKADILSVYPCTTTAALNTLESGLPPIAHGWLGWNAYFKEVQRCVDLFSNHISGVVEGVSAAKYHLANTLMPYEKIFHKIKNAPGQPDAVYEVSPFTVCRARSSSEVCAWVKTLCAEPERKFIYTYHHQPDHHMHDYGCYDNRIRFLIEGINAQLEALCAELTDTLVIITADHGLRDMKMLCMEDYPQVQECLAQPVSIEPRCVSLFIRDGYHEIFEKRFREAFGDAFILLTKEDALEKRLFGWGQPHAKALDFLGDYIAVATGEFGLSYRDNHGEFNDFKAGHAGLDAREMTVPLIVI